MRPRPLLAATLALVTATVLSTVPAAAAKGTGGSRCPAAGAVSPLSGPANTLEEVQAAAEGHPQIGMVRYPRPDGPPGGTNPWSQWGQGLVLADGRFVSALGDHRGADGNSYLFVFDPKTGELTRFTDVLSHVQHTPGDWGYGKIHAQIVPGPCGDAYLATYWGSRTDLVYTAGYRGDLLFRLDPSDLSLQSLGAPVPEHGIPSLASRGRNGLVYGEATLPDTPDPARPHDQGAFFVYDVRRKQVVFRSDDPSHAEFRNVLLDAKGRAYVAGENGSLLVYERGAAALRPLDQRLPGGGYLRASTAPAPDGTVYGVTEDPEELFAMAADGTIRDLGMARGYTASLVLDPDGSRFFYVPGAHGDAYEQGTPVIAVDTATGAQTVVTELTDLAEQHLGLTLGGSYSVAIHPKGTTLYVGLNAGETRDEPWGEVVLAVVKLTS